MGTAIEQKKILVGSNDATFSLWKRFIKWAEGQEENRFFWLAIGIVGHGCVFTIITMMVVLSTGNNFIYWPFAIAAMAMTVVSNLAALPTKITIPIFFLSLLIDAVIILLCLLHSFSAIVVNN